MEKLPSRREADKSNYEQTEKYQAMEKLTEMGMLMRMSDLELYHGRAGNGQPWRVESGFDNAGNNTGNWNINKTPALSTAKRRSIASEFAMKRARGRGLNPEVYEIVSDDPDARIINLKFNYDDLGTMEQVDFTRAMRRSLPGVMEAVPVDFSERETLNRISPRDFVANRRDGLYYAEEIRENAERLQLSNKFAQSITSVMNTRYLLGAYPGMTRTLVSAYMDNLDNINITENGTKKELPISREYLANWFRSNHIVGCEMPVRSATLGKTIDNYLLFDLEKVNTSAEEERKAKLRDKRLGQIAMTLMKNEQKTTERNELIASLEDNLYIKPEKIVSLAEKTPGYREIFEADAGNWEGYRLAEHTETVLRLFDDNYADKMPASTLPIMRMALLVHDVGKPVAVKNHKKEYQAAYNQVYAEDFMRKNGVDEKNQKLILAMIGEGSMYAKWWGVEHERVDKEFYDFCERTMQEYLGVKHVDRHTATGFRDMLMVFQTCDSAAYTTMAVTRNRDTGVRYRNYGSFNKSFEDYHGLTGNRVKLL